MNKILSIMLFAVTVATPSFADQDIVALQVPPTPPAAPAPPAAAALPAPPAPLAIAPLAPRAQAAPAAPAPPARAAAPAPPAPPGTSRLATPRNVRFDIVITDSGGPKPVTKAVSLTVMDNNASGSIRNIARLSPQGPTAFVSPGPGVDGPPQMVAISGSSFPLNLDVRSVNGYDDGSIRASINVEYQPYIPDSKTQPGVITASATALFQDGRKIQILQSTDPLTDRKTIVEVTATILK